MPANNNKAPSASSKRRSIRFVFYFLSFMLIVGVLVGCSSSPYQPLSPQLTSKKQNESKEDLGDDGKPLPAPIRQEHSQWIPVPWSSLPGFDQDRLHEAWNAWLKSCQKPVPLIGDLCLDVRRLSISDGLEQRKWIVSRFQAYKVENLSSNAVGMLTAYYEPELKAHREASDTFSIPLYGVPYGVKAGSLWHTREAMETNTGAMEQLKGHEIVYVADAVDALILQIQGSGRVEVTEPDGTIHWIRLAFAATNNQPYQSVTRWLLDNTEWREFSWPGIKKWASNNQNRVREMLWSNPRVVFFREEPLSNSDDHNGPRGAEGVSLTPGRSIAVDPKSIPYGTPVWLVSEGSNVKLRKLVMAQDTGSAIVGAVRADYFAGSGSEAGEFAGRIKQDLQLWVLWPNNKQP